MSKGSKKAQAALDPYVVMDNGNRFYLRVIGMTPLSLSSKKRRSPRK